MTVYPLSEGAFTIDASKRFIPFDPGSDRLEQRPKGSLLVEIQPFCVVTRSEVVLLDTGLGQKGPDGTLQIHQNLAQAGLSATDVSWVLLSHLHADHAGGIGLDLSTSGEQRLAFPQARYCVQRQELEHAYRQGGPSYHPRELEVLASSDQLLLLDGDGQLGTGIRYARSGGHAPNHQVFWLEEQGQTLFFGGDEAPQLQQMKHRFIAKYDFDGRRAMELRKAWWEQGRWEAWTFLFYHDLKSPTAVPG